MAFVQSHPAEEASERFKRHFPKGRDVTLIILKGHLLVEEQLNTLLAVAVAKPVALSKARLSFSQRVCLLTATHPHVSANEILALERLNSLRNLLAHQLEPAEVPRAICAFLEAVWPGRPKTSRHEYSLIELKQSIALVAGTLNGLRQGIAAVVDSAQPT